MAYLILAGGCGVKADSFVSVTMLIIAVIYGEMALVTLRWLKEKGKSNPAAVARDCNAVAEIGKPQINRINRFLPTSNRCK